MAINMRYLVAVSAIFFSIILSGCGDGSSSSSSQNNEVYSALPEPEEHYGVDFHPAGLFSLSDSGKSKGRIGKAEVSEYSAGTSHDNSEGNWAFGLDKEALTATLGSDAVEGYEKNINGFVSDVVSHPSVIQKLNDVMTSFPMFTGAHVFTAADIDNRVQLTSVSVADGVYTSTGDVKSLIRLNLSVPAIFTKDNSAAVSACSDEIQTLLSENFVQPANAEWSYGLNIVLTFITDNRESTHLYETEHSITDAEMSQVADDFGLILWFLQNLANHDIPSYDIVFSLTPSKSLSDSLGDIQGLAKETENAECQMAIDSVMPEASLIIPLVTSSAALDGDYEYYTHRYSEDLDNLSAGSEYGSSCLHDGDGNIISMGDDSTCSSGSGTYLFSTSGKSKDGTTILSVRTPYEKKVDTRTTKGFCNSSPWNQLRTPRFGRGIRLSLTEWAIHGQVADHWNIHWYQRPGAALTQSAISDAAYLVKIVAQQTLVGGSWWGFAASSASLAYKYASKFDISIAGHKMGGDTNSRMGDLIVALIRFATLSDSVKKYAQSIAISQTVEGVAQIIQTQATGWQDYYSGSHKVCGYQFN